MPNNSLKNMAASKKGFVEAQFNWAFVLIAGAIMLLLFTGIMSKQKNISERSADALAIRNLDAILASSEINAGTVDMIKLPNSKISFECSRYSIGAATRKIIAMSIFTPSVLDSDSVIFMALGWNAPYRITNFVYLTSPKIKYIFIGDSDFARRIFLSISEEISKEGYTNAKAIQDEKDGIVRLIFFGQDPEVPEALKGMKDGTVTALRVTGDERSGTVEFFDLSDGAFKSKGASYYIKEASLLGAIFTDKIDLYNCAMENAFNKLNIISKIYEAKISKTRSLYETTPGNDACKVFYTGSVAQISDDLAILSSSKLQNGDFDYIINAAGEIEKKNNEAEDKSCILIY